MSRVGDDWDGDDFPNQSILWQAATERALKGRRGQRALEDLREALLALPEPRLISRAFCTASEQTSDENVMRWGGDEIVQEEGLGVCAVGAFAWHQRVKAGMSPEEAFASLPFAPDYDDGSYETERAGVEAGLLKTIAYRLMWLNDYDLDGCTPEERYERVLAWIDRNLLTPAGAA